ncbi:radical SAM protein [Carboxydocella sp. JDF658]|uniref:radical SAM protein n=1 Tax=Carboxydocella sp. JDF658 TaxID=1926600 RepID=UPI0009AE2E29|nr:radical SAM protein [Carboxydocella sp. JDF658]
MGIRMLVADARGRVMDIPGWGMAGRSGRFFTEPHPEEMIPLPPGASLTLLPGCRPVGVDRLGKIRVYERYYAVAALLPQGYTRTLLPAYQRVEGDKPLPLLGYTAVGWAKGRYWVAASKTDRPRKWNPLLYNTPDLAERVARIRKELPHNRIIRQLARCSLDYGCLTAQNIFYRRWEGGIPVSPACNARCVGCISLQPAECCPSPQERIGFSPTREEIVEVALPHLQQAEGAIVSFGQGCEGEPSLAAPLIAEAIKEIRTRTSQGTINMNTNAGYTEGIRLIAEAGIDSLRVSLNSAQPDWYQAYYRPPGYTLRDVRVSLSLAARQGVFLSLNYLVFPGVSDQRAELEALVELVKSTGVKLIQLRNLNIDPDMYCQLTGVQEPGMGMVAFLKELRRQLPGVSLGNFSRPLR